MQIPVVASKFLIINNLNSHIILWPLICSQTLSRLRVYYCLSIFNWRIPQLEWKYVFNYSVKQSFLYLLNWSCRSFFTFTHFFLDLYQITMAYAYWKAGKIKDYSVFDLFFRKNPFQGEFTIFAGLEECLKFLERFHYSESGRKIVINCLFNSMYMCRNIY